MSIADTLKKNGYTDEQIASITGALGSNADAVKAFESGLNEADTKLAQATAKETRLNEWWQNEATPQINEVHSKVAQAEARAAFYQKQVESAKESGFIPADAPAAAVTVTQTRDGGGRFVPGANDVPGSPKFMTQDEGWTALSTASWAMAEYSRLNEGKPIPDDIADLVKESQSVRKPFKQYVEEKYNFGGRRKEIAEAAQKAHDEKVAKDAVAKDRQEQAERYGSNPDLRPGATSLHSRFPQPSKDGKQSWSDPNARENMRQKAHELVRKQQGSVQ